ncbi:MAG: SRPBCC family protein [Nocardioides sp.]|nr:SRPBCC family protein [Nocardioides sp.]
MDTSHLDLTHRESVVVATTPERLYSMLCDVTRTGEWSPTCTACWWDDDVDVSEGVQVGAWFTGRNEVPDRTWETRSQVVAADPGQEFAWQVGGSLVRWGYLLVPTADGGTELTETWEYLPDGLALFAERYGDDALAQVEDRTRQAHEGIPRTLAAIKTVAEAS